MIDLTVKTLDSQNHFFSLEDDQITVRGFKEYIAESVAVPADSQRLIYCGRVLQDEKKLNDYDVNGKVIHLVQRAPPQQSQRGNDNGQPQGQNNRQQGWQNSQRSHYRLTRTQMHGNAMYLGAMSVPAEFVEGHGIPQLSNSLSASRLSHAGRMLDRINELLDRLDDPSSPPLHPTPSEMADYAQPPIQQQHLVVQESEAEQDESGDASRTDGGARIAEAAAAAITAALSAAGARAVTLFRGGNYTGTDARATVTTNETTEGHNDVLLQQTQSQPQPQQPQPQSQPQSQQAQPQSQPPSQSQPQSQPQQTQATTEQSTSSNAGQNRRAQQLDLPRPPQMAELLQRLYDTQDRLRPYLIRYCAITLVDPSLPPGPRPNTVDDNQRLVDGVSEILHLMSHTCHALSDIIIDMSQPPPRNLRCRPIIVQHSAILQPGIPIQVEAHISLNGRGTNNNNSNDEATEPSNQQAQSDNAESVNPPHVNTEQESSQERESDNSQQPGERPQQEQGQSPFDTVFNLPNNVEVLMEVSSESNIDGGSGNEQSATGESNNSSNTRRTTGVFPFGAGPPPYFMRNFMQAVAGHMVHGGITTTTISTRNPPTTAAQTAPASMDSGTTNAGQSTQARSNVGTHPTTATQTRSTSRPHVFHHHPHPVGLGMSIGLGLDFDPYLPCNSHHVYRMPTPNASANGGMTNSQTTRTASTTATETQNQTQSATTSTTTTNATSTNTTSTTNVEAGNNNPFVNLMQQILGTSGRTQPNISINSNAPDLAESLGNIIQMLGSGNIHVHGFGSDGNSIGSAFTLADLFESGGLSMDLFTSQESGREENFLIDLSVLVAQNMSLEDLVRLRLGQWEPIDRLRRPLQEFLQDTFSNASSPEALQEQAAERLLSQLRPHLRDLLAPEEDATGRNGSRVDISATVESLIARHTRDILRILFDEGIQDANTRHGRFGQEILNIVNNLGKQLCAVLRYSVRGGQAGLEAIVSRFVGDMLEGVHPALRQWMLNGFIVHFRTYSLRVPQPPDSEITSFLVYKDVPAQHSQSVPSASARQSTQAQPEEEPMETETSEQRPTREGLNLSEDREEVSETIAENETLPSDWVPIIARDGVRQRRQLQGMNSGVTTFSDAYLGGLPSKRRKLIEQQKPRLLVSPTPNHSTIAASMERLVREGVGRAGVEEVEGAAVAVAADPTVRHAFGQAIRDCLNPCRYSTPDFPDPLRFPNATKYFTDQERPPK